MTGAPRRKQAQDAGAPSNVEDIQVVSVGATSSEPADLVVLESCHSTWLFSPGTKKFKRLLKGLDLDPLLAMTSWRSYERLELAEESEAFVVVLDAAGSRQICSWRHVDGCKQCDGEVTVELTLEEVRRLARLARAGEAEPHEGATTDAAQLRRLSKRDNNVG